MSAYGHVTRIMGFLFVDGGFRSSAEVRETLFDGLAEFTDPEDSIDLYVLDRDGFNTSITLADQTLEFNSNKYVLLFGNIYGVTAKQTTEEWNRFFAFAQKQVKVIDSCISIKDIPD